MSKLSTTENKTNDSESKNINSIAKKLQKKYTSKRKVNEKALNKSLPVRIFSAITSAICVVVALFALLFFISSINASFQKVVPSFAGYSTLRVSSGSMVKSGFEVGGTVVVKSVDTSTLKPDDVIAFYTYSSSYYGVNSREMKVIPTESIGDQKSGLTFMKFFGVQNAYMQEAAKSGSMLVLHHIRSVYEDSNGKRWFSTYGSSNAADDTWLISEDYVVGTNDNSGMGIFVSRVMNFASTMFGKLTLIIIPVCAIGLILIKQLLYDIQISRLQLSVVEEKRKLTDPLCIRYQIGYSMDNKTKYKVLAQADAEDINLYLSLLWRKGSAPANIRKYYLRKKVLVDTIAELRDVNRNCEQMFANGTDPKEIARYYDTSKKEIKKKYHDNRKKLKLMREKYSEENV